MLCGYLLLEFFLSVLMSVTLVDCVKIAQCIMKFFHNFVAVLLWFFPKSTTLAKFQQGCPLPEHQIQYRLPLYSGNNTNRDISKSDCW